ncbi:hypothetical protein GCM10010182_56690 [Actinomadura cremea]|nr:hypothetical protein GCM10010182_56690 [Actinomadura cremea]
MSREIIVLSPHRPDIGSVRAPGLSIRNTYVFDVHDQLLVRIGVPVLVSVSGEAERLLGVSISEPTWWVELHAAASLQAEQAARHCANGLAAQHNGTIWSAR